jgi:hypothetical protein
MGLTSPEQFRYILAGLAFDIGAFANPLTSAHLPGEHSFFGASSLSIPPLSFRADVAQLVEQPIRNRQVIGSSPIVGSSFSIG